MSIMKFIKNKLKKENSCYTYFRITGDFVPEEITKILGIEPYESRKKGDKTKSGRGICQFSSWKTGKCDEYDVYVEEQMRKTIKPLLNKIDELNLIREKYDACFSLEVVPSIYEHNYCTPVLSPPLDVMEFCCKTKTEIDIDYYIY